MLVFRGLFQTKNKTKNNIVMHTEDLDMHNIPQHIAIIMDGNGRWAKAQGKVRTFGHQAGAETLKTIVRAADKLGVKGYQCLCIFDRKLEASGDGGKLHHGAFEPLSDQRN